LSTVTVCVAVAPVAVSLSVADAETAVFAGPSPKLHSKLPDVLSWDSEPFVPAPQLAVTELIVS
jgi:hypothetical protein